MRVTGIKGEGGEEGREGREGGKEGKGAFLLTDGSATSCGRMGDNIVFVS